MTVIIDLILFAATGALAGTAAGLLGIGGGLVVVPCLAYIFTHLGMQQAFIMHMASATSLAAMMFTASVSTFSHHRRGAVLWPVFWQLLPGVIIGVVLGIILASVLTTTILKIIFGIFLLLIAVRMFFSFRPKPSRGLPGPLGNFGVALAIGGKSGLLGVGGGALIVPYLTYCNVSIREAAGTSAACGLPIAIFGTISAFFTGWHVTTHEAYSIGYVYWPAAIIVAIFSITFVFVGAKLSKVLPIETIKRIFAVVLFLAALDLLF